VPPLESILSNLARAQKELLRAADNVPLEYWKTRPNEKAWSAAEVVAHLIIVERGIIATADRVTQEEPKEFPLWKRFHLPMMLVEARVVRRKTPVPLNPEMVREKEDMLAELRTVRERTLAFVDETRGRELSAYCWRHPFLGTMNVYEWLQMIASHEVRHTKQIREIAADLPKVIEGLQK